MKEHRIITVNHDRKIEQLVKEIINCPEKQVILEIDPDVSLLNNEINLRLIMFYAEEEAKDLIISTVNPALVSLAQRLGISTIREKEPDKATGDDDISDYVAAPATTRNKSFPPESGARRRALAERRNSSRHNTLFPAVLVVFFTFIMAFWWFLQPRARIIVYPKEQYLNFRAKVSLSPNYDDNGLGEGKIQGKIFEKVAKIEVNTVTTGYKMIGVTPALGRVTLVNSTVHPVVLPKGAVFSGKNGVRFKSNREVLVPKKFTKFQQGIAVGEEYGRAEVEITAEKNGVIGNQPAKAINRIEGNYQRYLKVLNLAPTRNGADRRVPVVTLEDARKGENEARNQMQLAGADEAAALVDQDHYFLPELVDLELIRVANSSKIGVEAETVTTVLEYRVTVLTPPRAVIHKYLLAQLEKNMPARFESKNNEVVLVSARVAEADAEEAEVELIGKGAIRGVLDRKKIRELIKGKTVAQAKELLTKQDEIADFQIDTDRNNRKLPSFSFQIKIIFPSGAH